MLSTFDLTLVTFLACLMALGQARSVQGYYQPQGAVVEGYDYTYGDLAYQYDTPRETTEKDVVHPRQKIPFHREQGAPSPQELGTFSYTYNNPSDYDYSYGDPNYDYDYTWNKPTERGSDDPRPTKDDHDEDEDDSSTAAPEGEDDHDEDDHDSNKDEDDHDDSNAAPEGEDDHEDDQDDSTAAPEGEDDHGDDQDDSTTSRVLQWFENQWYKAKRTLRQLVVELRKAKGSVVEFLHQLSDVVEKGAKYSISRLKGVANQLDSRGERALDKLVEALRQGNEDVKELFRLLGVKVQEWTGRHPQQEARVLGVAQVVPGPTMHDQGQDGVVVNDNSPAQYVMQQNDVEMKPNFFQDAAVSAKLSQLVEAGVLTQEELRAVLETP